MLYGIHANMGKYIICILIIVLWPCGIAYSQEREVRIRTVDFTTPLVGTELQAEYYLSIGDKINISVWKNPDLSKGVVISPDGTITYPLVGSLKAADLTVKEFQNIMKKKLELYIRYPDVTVTLQDVAGKKIVILGQVGYPGVYSFEGGLTLVEAIGLAGGIARSGKRESVIVVSGNLTDHPTARRVNFFKAIRKGSSDPGLCLAAGDVVYVPRTFISDLIAFLGDFSSIMDNAAQGDLINMWDWRKELRKFYLRNVKSKSE